MDTNLPESIIVTNNEDKKRYEADLGGEIAYLEYILAKTMIVLAHTEVPIGYEGQGIASKMIRFVLEDARARSLPVNPICPFVISFIGRHPEYQELVPENLRR